MRGENLYWIYFVRNSFLWQEKPSPVCRLSCSVYPACILHVSWTLPWGMLGECLPLDVRGMFLCLCFAVVLLLPRCLLSCFVYETFFSVSVSSILTFASWQYVDGTSCACIHSSVTLVFDLHRSVTQPGLSFPLVCYSLPSVTHSCLLSIPFSGQLVNGINQSHYGWGWGFLVSVIWFYWNSCFWGKK